MAKHAWLPRVAMSVPTQVVPAPVTGMDTAKLLDPQPRHRMRIAATSVAILYDMGAPLGIDCFALISTNLLDTATLQFRASTTDPSATGALLYDSGALAGVTHPVFNGNVICTLPAPVTARYWRVDITGAVNPIDIGLIKIGTLFRPSRNYAYGAREGRVDLSTREKNPHTGGDFCTVGPTLRTRLITIAGLTLAELRETFDFFDYAVGAGGDVLWVDNPDADFMTRARMSVWGSFREIGADLGARIAAQNWARSFRVTERL